MHESRVGTRELKSKLSEYLRRVKTGETIVVTERGKPIGQIVPIKASLEERQLAMVVVGLAEWNGKNLTPYEPKAINQSERLVSDLVIEDRQ